MPSLVVAHRRPGFYLCVLEDGPICAGDPIFKDASGPQSLSVADTSALLYSAEHPKETLRRALQITALSPGWRQSFEELLAADGTHGNPGLAPQNATHWSRYREVVVREVVQESADVRSFLLGAEDDLPTARAGQYIALRLALPDGRTITRSYSLSGAPNAGTYRISVKREDGGVVSAHLHDHVREGTRLEIAAPRGSFAPDGDAKQILLVSAGIGAMPMLHVLASAANAEQTVWWLHAARDGSRHSFAREAKGLLGKIAGARSLVVYSRPDRLDTPGRDYDAIGHVDRGLLRRLSLPKGSVAYICGPRGFVDGAREALIALGHDEGRIKSEAFGPDKLQGAATGRRAPREFRKTTKGPGRTRRSQRAASRSPGTNSSTASSLLRKPAPCPCDGPAAPACVIPAKPRFSTDHLPTGCSHSMRRRQGRS